MAVLPPGFGKGRPALVVQSNAFNETHTSIVVCPITSHLIEAPLFRLSLRPTSDNGLKVPSQVMIDKMNAIKREKINRVIGRASAISMQEVDRALQLWLAID